MIKMISVTNAYVVVVLLKRKKETQLKKQQTQ